MEAEVLTGDSPARRLGLPSRLLGDEHLAQQIGAGDERAFAVLFQRYHQQLYRYCCSLTGSDQDAQDALQTALTKALVALRAGRRNAPVRPWLFRIAHNESISVIRARGSAVELPTEMPGAQALSDSLAQRERLAMLVADLRELPEQQRGALVMRELSGLSHEEIAAALQLSVGAAKQSILEARRSLQEFAEGRAMTCDEIQRIVSDDDRRSLRSRRVKAHLRDCGACAAFAQAIPRRRAELRALSPMLPAAGAAGLLAKITGAGSGHGGGGAGLAAGAAAKGVGATVSAKFVAAVGAAAVATAGVGAVAVLHRGAPAQAGPVATPASGSARGSGSGHGAHGSGLPSGGGRHSGAKLGRAHAGTEHGGSGHGTAALGGQRQVKQSEHGRGVTQHGRGSAGEHGNSAAAKGHAVGTHGNAHPTHGNAKGSVGGSKSHAKVRVHHHKAATHRHRSIPHKHATHTTGLRTATRKPEPKTTVSHSGGSNPTRAKTTGSGTTVSKTTTRSTTTRTTATTTRTTATTTQPTATTKTTAAKTTAAKTTATKTPTTEATTTSTAASSGGGASTAVVTVTPTSVTSTSSSGHSSGGATGQPAGGGSAGNKTSSTA